MADVSVLPRISDDHVRVIIEAHTPAGDPVNGLEVRVRDLTDSTDIGTALTDGTGRIEMREEVGGVPCNQLEMHVPALGMTEMLGCFNGGEQAVRRINIPEDLDPDLREGTGGGGGSQSALALLIALIGLS